ncbi:MAG: hypothetical protein L6R36_005615 [Xanthoria steineri]|nr:MAG: hypothetical protein L6R36_005615 [Xanthoria steineri]
MDMDNMLGGGGGAIGQFPLEQWFYEMPVCTRWWTAATVATSLLVQCQIITPFQLFYSFRAVFVKNQVCARVPNIILGTVSGALFVAIALRDFDPPMPLADAFNALPGFSVEQQLGLHLVPEESRDKA